MGTDNKLFAGFSESESGKIKTHLDRLLHYLKPDGFAIVGGLVIRYHLISKGINYPQRPFNDLDMIIRSPDVVSTAVAKDFLIYHYHPESFFLALVDPISKIKDDIFSFDPAPKQLEQVHFGGRNINVISIEDQIVKTVLDIQRISPETKVDPKQFFDTGLLAQVADMVKANNIWQSYKFEKYPDTINKAIERAEGIAAQHPEWTEEKPFRKPEPYICTSCRSANGFKIVPMGQVYKILGYVE